MSINFNLVGQRVREYRCGQSLRQDELAWNAELSVPYLSRIENGAKVASLRTIVRIADALNVSANILLFGEMADDEKEEFHELAAILSDCAETERSIIMETVLGTATALKRSLRRRAEEVGKKYLKTT